MSAHFTQHPSRVALEIFPSEQHLQHSILVTIFMKQTKGGKTIFWPWIWMLFDGDVGIFTTDNDGSRLPPARIPDWMIDSHVSPRSRSLLALNWRTKDNVASFSMFQQPPVECLSVGLAMPMTCLTVYKHGDVDSSGSKQVLHDHHHPQFLWFERLHLLFWMTGLWWGPFEDWMSSLLAVSHVTTFLLRWSPLHSLHKWHILQGNKLLKEEKGSLPCWYFAFYLSIWLFILRLIAKVSLLFY